MGFPCTSQDWVRLQDFLLGKVTPGAEISGDRLEDSAFKYFKYNFMYNYEADTF